MAPPDAALSDALRRLAPGDRALLELSFLREVPDAEIGTLLDVPAEQVRLRRERLLEQLGTAVGSAGATVEELRAALLGDGARATREPAENAGVAELRESAPGGDSRPVRDPLPGAVRRAPSAALLLLPGALTAYLGFHGGGFFPGGTAAAAIAVCLAIVLRLTLAPRPAAGLGVLGVLVSVLLGTFAVWTLLSGEWSDAPARALLEFDRAMLYALTFLLYASVPRSARSIRVMLWGFAGAATAVCLTGLASRVLPDLLPSASSVSKERLAYPVTYWNALGMLAVLGILACLHIAAGDREPRCAKMLATGAVPGLAVTLFFTFSRGAIAVAVISLPVYAVLARPRGLLAACLAAVPASATALVVAYGADLLATKHPTAPAAAGQAHRVALVTGAAMLLAALVRLALTPLDARLSAVRLSWRRKGILALAAGAVGVVALTGTAVALDVPNRLERQYDRFVEGQDIKDTGDARRRLTNPGNNGRLDHWRVAVDAAKRHRVRGGGAGTYALVWAKERPVQFTVLDAHSLYLETLAELGLVGFILLVGALLALAVGLAVRIRGPDRSLYAAIFAMALAWVIRAGVDWDWEMPVITLWLFAIGGAVVAKQPMADRRGEGPPRLARVLLAFVALALSLTPGLIYLSQEHLDRATRGFERGDCGTAVDQALASNSALSIRPEPFEVLAYCDVRLGRPGLAVKAMQEAVQRDPDAWQLRYGLALVRAAAGRDPRAAARAALRLNPLEPLTRDAVERFSTGDPEKWRRRALGARLPNG